MNDMVGLETSIREANIPKQHLIAIFRPGESVRNYQEVWYNEGPSQPGTESQIGSFPKEFTLKQ